ncbi:MAG: aminopeptidase, partial [Pedosphaera sp.]|nr:aminopeptidase [Pedosphaera sp.]
HHLFVKGDTTFNESFATAFAQIGVTEWAKAKQNPQALEDYLARRQTKHMVNQLYVQKKIELKAIYESLETEEEKREAKKQFIAEFRQQLNDMSLSDPRLSKLAILAKRPINNAVLGARAAYHQYVPAFHRLYGESNQDIRIFLDKVQAISKLNKLERDTLLDKYSRQDEMPVKKLLTN